MKTYKRITIQERERISHLFALGNTLQCIASDVGRTASTIGREIRRNLSKGEYLALSAPQKAERRQRYSHAPKQKIDQNQKLKLAIYTKLRLRWSPQQISVWLKTVYGMSISHETIYKYIYVQAKGELRKELISYLRQRKPRRKSRKLEHDKRGTIPDMISIHERPEAVEDRTVPGHWEGDLMIGRDHQSSIGTLVERSTRYLLIVKLKNRDSKFVCKEFSKIMRQLPKSLAQSMTYDRGKEMTEHKKFTMDTKMKVYFCDPHSPWQRGTNENTNGLIRDFFPKGTDFDKISRKQLLWVQEALNERPRKTLGYDTPKNKMNKLIKEHLLLR
jgi:IS30 family transposase